ncbi:hypothetical protein [Actinomadura opuntiae]|uniref:hypothetical protein n=1 Tax=Actinomadura sp. OS1-43 TaxID=604315 RepID=UPI00255AD55E|nr:hypothetical protein [Actinomadura sp. OS1-43]MDL4815483.1 hypothetical protein [Actinomadura sp. OS1-43]
MITVNTIQAGSPHLSEAAAQYLTDLWNTAYPHMRTDLTEVIAAHRNASLRRPGRQRTETAKEIRRYESVRRELGQLDRGTHRPCSRSEPRFSLFAATNAVRHALDALPVDSPHAGDIYRLAAELSDLRTAEMTRIKQGEADHAEA